MTWRITWLGSICATLLLVARVSATVHIDPSCAMQGDGSIGEPCAAGLMLDGSTYYGADKQTQWGN